MQIYEKDGCMVSIEEETGELLSVARLLDSSVNINIPISGYEAKFLLEELDLDIGKCREIQCDAETANNIIRICFTIESEEAVKFSDGELSERGKIASKLIDLIHGPYMEDTQDSNKTDKEVA